MSATDSHSYQRSYSYQWERDGVAVPGATTATYTLQEADRGATMVCVVTASNGAGSASARSAATAPVTGAVVAADALGRRTLAELADFTGWCTKFGVAGCVGEFGVPSTVPADQAHWNALLDTYYAALAEADLESFEWSSGKGWGTGYPLGVYVNGVIYEGLSLAQPTAAVFARHALGTAGRHGVALSGAEFPVTGPGGVDPRAGYQFWHDADDIAYLAGQGVESLRIGLAWEIMQPNLGGGLSPAALGLLDVMLQACHLHGVQAVLDLHNYVCYTPAGATSADLLTLQASGGDLTDADLSRFWVLMSDWVGADAARDAAVRGFGLMNEPHDLADGPDGIGGAQVWAEIAQAVVTTVRAAGDGRRLYVPGYFYSEAQVWATTHPAPFITDPKHNFAYEAHHYFDTTSSSSRSGTYLTATGGVTLYSGELAAAVADGY